jgi:hypothetical protein
VNTTIITRPASTSTTKPLPFVAKFGPTFYRAESRSLTLGTHDVKLTTEGWQCDCKGYYWRFSCAHVDAVEAQEALSDREIEEDLSDLADWLREEGNGEISPLPFNPNYSDGTPKPYGPSDSHMEMVRKAQATWRWDD